MTNPESPALMTRALLAGLISAVIFTPITKLVLEGVVVLTVSVGPTQHFARLITTATALVALASFCSGAVAHYVGQTRN